MTQSFHCEFRMLEHGCLSYLTHFYASFANVLKASDLKENVAVFAMVFTQQQYSIISIFTLMFSKFTK